MSSLWTVWNQRGSLIFHPTHDIIGTPSAYGYKYSNIQVETISTIVKGWILPGNHENYDNKKLIIFSHGNSGNMSHRREFMNFFEKYLRHQYALFMYDYPGFGDSAFKESSTPSLQPNHISVSSCKQSLHDVIGYAITKLGYESKDICLYGESIGAAITATVASETRLKFEKVVLQSTFTSIAAMASQFSFVLSMAAFFLPEELDVVNALGSLKLRKANVLIMHSETDEIIPFSMFCALKKYCRKSLVLVGGHNETVLDERVAKFILDE